MLGRGILIFPLPLGRGENQLRALPGWVQRHGHAGLCVLGAVRGKYWFGHNASIAQNPLVFATHLNLLPLSCKGTSTALAPINAKDLL